MQIIRGMLALAAAVVAIAVSAPAAAVLIDFEGVVLNGSGTGDNTAVQNYLNSLLGAGFVTVYGTVADRAYDAEGRVNKPTTGPNAGRPVTLGTTDGATSPTDYTHFHPGLDTFIRNVGSSISGSSNTPWGSVGNDKFVFVFRDPIFNISFDWEVFPDGTCGSCTNGPNFPDFELWAGLQGAANPLYTFGPGAPNFPVNVVSGYAQGIGTFSAVFPQGVTRVEFVDWPQRIAIDRLDPTRVPEPGSIALLGLAAVAGLLVTRSRSRYRRAARR